MVIAAALPTTSVEAIGMRLSWTVHQDSVELRLASPGNGWLAVGFNHEAQLAGARLIMARVRADVVEAEEHLADPPDHARVEGARVVVLGGRQHAAGSEVQLRIPLAGRVPLKPGARLHVILAFSDSDDFQHHSRARTHVTITL